MFETGRKPRRRERVLGRVDSFPEPLLVSEVSREDALTLGLECVSGQMYLRLQRERVWSAARRRRAARRSRGGDTETFWEDDADWVEETSPELLPREGELLYLEGAEKHATTRILRVEPLPRGRRLDTVVVGCLRVHGLTLAKTGAERTDAPPGGYLNHAPRGRQREA